MEFLHLTDKKHGKMDSWLSALIEQGNVVSIAAEKEFKDLNVDELNWKPAPDKWSIGQCLHHIITSNETYFPMLKSIILGTYTMNRWERFNPLSGFLGKKLSDSMLDVSKGKFKAPGVFKPSSSDIPGDIVKQFVRHQEKFLSLLKQTAKENHDKIIVTSPVSAVITYSLKDCFNILIHHEQRHLKQALNVKELLKKRVN